MATQQPKRTPRARNKLTPTQKASKPAKPAKRGKVTARDEMGLTHRQAAFRMELLKGLNVNQAALAAGIAAQTGYDLLQDDIFKNAYRQGQAEIRRSSRVTIDHLIEELAFLGFTRAADFFNAHGGLLDPKEWTDLMSAQVASIEVDELFEGTGQERTMVGFTKKLKFWNKPAALDQLARILGAYKADREQGAPRVGFIVVPAKTPVSQEDDLKTVGGVELSKPPIPKPKAEAFRLLRAGKEQATDA